MVRKRWFLLIGPLLMVVMLTGCGLASGGGGSGETMLRLGHQWPGADSEGEGDFRAVLAQKSKRLPRSAYFRLRPLWFSLIFYQSRR